jgi:hypothetical protein
MVIYVSSPTAKEINTDPSVQVNTRSLQPSSTHSDEPSNDLSTRPSINPTGFLSDYPSVAPGSDQPSSMPTVPTTMPTTSPSSVPSDTLSQIPSTQPNHYTSSHPFTLPSGILNPINDSGPSTYPTPTPSRNFIVLYESSPTIGPINNDQIDQMNTTIQPISSTHAVVPMGDLTDLPTSSPSEFPSDFPSLLPSVDKPRTEHQIAVPTIKPRTSPPSLPTDASSFISGKHPSSQPSQHPSIDQPTDSSHGTTMPSKNLTSEPTSTVIFAIGISSPSMEPSNRKQGSQITDEPFVDLTTLPSSSPSRFPSDYPSLGPSLVPTYVTAVPSVTDSSTPIDQTSDAPSKDVVGSGSPLSNTSTDPLWSVSPTPTDPTPSTNNPTEKFIDEPSLRRPTLNPTLKKYPDFDTLAPSFWVTDGRTTLPTDEPSLIPSSALASLQKSPIEFSAIFTALPTLDNATASGNSSTTDSPDRSSLVDTKNHTGAKVPKPNTTATIIMTASYSTTLKDQLNTLDSPKVAIFESVALSFLQDHYSRIVDESAIEFESVKIVSQTPQMRRKTKESDVAYAIAEATSFPLPIDIDILFNVFGKILPGTGFGFMDFQRTVQTIFDVSRTDFDKRLENTEEFSPARIEKGTDAASKKTEEKSTNEESFSTWMIASLGAVVFSVFLTAVLVTGAVRRARRPRHDQEQFTPTDFRSSPSHLKNDTRRQSPSIYTGLSAGFEEESLDGLRLAHLASSTKSGPSTTGGRFSKEECGSIIIPVEETNDILNKLSSANPHKERGLNARMRKRLIEREVQSYGYEAGLSMEAILKATSSFTSDDEGCEQRSPTHPSPIDVGLGNSDYDRTRIPTKGGLLSNWFGRRGEKLEYNEDPPRESRTTFTLESARFYSPDSSACDIQNRSGRKISIPSKAEVITVGESIKDEQFPISTTNWDVWDCPSAARTPTIPEIAEKDEEENFKSTFKFIRPGLKKAALRVIRRRNEVVKSIQLSDDHQLEQHQRNFDISRGSSDDNEKSGLRKKHNMNASTPLWISEQTDNVMGFIHVDQGEDARRNSLAPFFVSPKTHRRPAHRTSIGLDAASSTSSTWKRPGKIKTEFQSSPLKRRLARARSDPPDYRNLTRQRQPRQEEYHVERDHDGHDQDGRENQASVHFPAPSPSHAHLPHSSVRLVKKTSSLSTLSRAQKQQNVEEYSIHSVSSLSRNRRGSGRIGASPLVEMNVASNQNAMILGSIEDIDGGLELEWGVTI